MMLKTTMLTAATSLCLAAHTTADTGLQLRLLVIDVSGSMGGQHIEEVRQDLRAHLRNHPPSKRSPVGMVLFAGQAQPVVWFREQDKALEFVNQIGGDYSGTSLAAGLTEAMKHIKKYGKKASISLVLYTDDQDHTPAKTKKAVEALSQLFTSQKQTDLDQSVVIRTWSDADVGARIKAILAKNPDVTVTHSTSPLFLKLQLSPPPLKQDYQFEFTAQPTGKVRWDKQNSRLAIYEIEWAVKATPKTSHNSRRREFSVQLSTSSVGKLLGGQAQRICRVPGNTKGTVELAVPVSKPEWHSGSITAQPELHAKISRQPHQTVISPVASKSVIQPLPTPPAVKTEIELTATSVTPGKWYEVPNISFYKVEALLSVKGPVPEGSTLTVSSPPGVTRCKISPDTFTEGTQTVEMLITAAVKPAPSHTQFAFQVSPPADSNFIHFVPPQPLEVRLPGPMKLQITTTVNPLRASAMSAADTTSIPATFSVEGLAHGKFVGQLQLALTSPKLAGSLGAFPPNQPVSIPLRGQQQPQSYFVDAIDSVPLLVTASNAIEVVKQANFPAEVRTIATFKLHLLVGLGLLTLIGVPVLIIRLVGQLKVAEEQPALVETQLSDYAP